MGRENTVYFYGRIEDSKIKVDDEYNYVSGKFVLDTIRRSSSNENHLLLGQERWDNPCVYSRNPEVIAKMAECKEGDMVFVKGTLCTQDSSRKFICPHCGNVQVEPMAVMIYVDPIYIKRMETGLSKEEAYQLIRDNYEISNQIFILGTLCREPDDVRDFVKDEERDIDRFQFQIASRRLRRIREDDPEKKVDYPWCKCYGDEAIKHHEMLHKGSSVYVDGSIQTRRIKLHATCEKCSEIIEKEAIATDIVPYHVEYIDKCGEPFEPEDVEDFTEPE